jgi:hypothetical protein
MTSTSKPKTASKADDPKALRVDGSAGESRPAVLSHVSLRPTVQAAATLMEFNKNFGELSLNTFVDDLVAQCKQASEGNLNRAEALLMAQAHTLDAIFNNLARRSARNMGEYVNAAEIYMRLALKAQTQCRATLETLAAIKNPQPVSFVKQQNIAAGPQQVNNGAASEFSHQYARAPARAENSENPPNKLLEQQHEEWLDARAPQTPVGADSALETVGEVDRAANARR